MKAVVRQVEGRVRSFVHSPLTTLLIVAARLIVGARTARAGSAMLVVMVISDSFRRAGQLAGVVFGLVFCELEEGFFERAHLRG